MEKEIKQTDLNGNTNFKFKIKRIEQGRPGLSSTSFNIKLDKGDFLGWDGGVSLNGGISQQMKNGNRIVYSKQDFTLDSLKEAFEKYFNGKNKKDGDRKGFNIKSEIFKQTYKFR